jgi:cytochrome c oxidase subunit 2
VRYWSLLFAVVAAACVATFVYAPFNAEWWLPAGPEPGASHLHSASSVGKEIDALYVILLWVTGAVFVGTQVALVWAGWKFADRPGRVATYFHGSQRLELIWTILPAIVLTFITIYQFGTWANVKFRGRAPRVAPLAEVTGRQFQWVIRYAGEDQKLHTKDDFTKINDLHFVKDETTLIQLQSKDVIHSFFLPQLRIKQDAVPGLKIPVWFDADQVGRYELACAELCGWGHYKMRGNVTVHATRAEFEDWVRASSREAVRDQVAAPTTVADEGKTRP